MTAIGCTTNDGQQAGCQMSIGRHGPLACLFLAMQVYTHAASCIGLSRTVSSILGQLSS